MGRVIYTAEEYAYMHLIYGETRALFGVIKVLSSKSNTSISESKITDNLVKAFEMIVQNQNNNDS